MLSTLLLAPNPSQGGSKIVISPLTKVGSVANREISYPIGVKSPLNVLVIPNGDNGNKYNEALENVVAIGDKYTNKFNVLIRRFIGSNTLNNETINISYISFGRN